MSGHQGYYLRYSDGPDYLWTVGFDRPQDGHWEPESDHDNIVDAGRRERELNGRQCRFAYVASGAPDHLFTVGDCSGGYWLPVSDHESAEEAATEVMELNAEDGA